MEVTQITDIKGKHTKMVQSPATGYVYRIRRMSVMDYHAAGLAGLFMPKSESSKKQELSPDDFAISNDLDQVLPAVGRLVVRGVVEPRLSLDDDAIGRPDLLHVSEIGGDDLWLFGQLVEYAGDTPANREEVEAFAGNGKGPDSSTGSPADTVGSPTKSSSSGPESSASRGTPQPSTETSAPRS